MSIVGRVAGHASHQRSGHLHLVRLGSASAERRRCAIRAVACSTPCCTRKVSPASRTRSHQVKSCPSPLCRDPRTR